MKISLLRDKFDSLDTEKWEVNGDDDYSFSSNGVTFNGYINFYTTDSTYELTGSGLFIELKSITLVNLYDEVEILDIDDGISYYVLGVKLVSGGQELFVFDSSTATYAYGAVYNSSIHKYFRIRELNSVLYFEFSTDLKTWSNIVAPVETINIYTDNTKLYIGSFTSGASITLDNLNIGNTPVTNSKYPLPAFKVD